MDTRESDCSTPQGAGGARARSRSTRSMHPGPAASAPPPRTAEQPGAARGGHGRTSGCTGRKAVDTRDNGSAPPARATGRCPPAMPPPQGPGAPGQRDRRRSPAEGRTPAHGRSAWVPTSRPCCATQAGPGSRTPQGAREDAGPPQRGTPPSAWSSSGSRRWSSTARCGCRSGTARRSPQCRRSGAA